MMEYTEEDDIILLNGKYKVYLKKEIGKGNYGTVYKCKDISIPKSKKKLCAKLTDILQGSKLSREFEVLSTLKTVARGNPNIIQVIDVLVHNKKYILIQERCQFDLAKLIQDRRIKKQIITPKEALTIIKQLSNGYKVLIAHKIIHRDIKPQNILFLNDTYKIADFGFARRIDRFCDHTKLGTQGYTAPEVLWSSYSCQADIFSLGVVFYQLIFDDFPFNKKIEDFKNQLFFLKENPVRVSRDLPEFQADDSIPQLIERMLLYNQDDRISWSQFFQHKLIIEHFENPPYNFVERLPTPDTEMEQEHIEEKTYSLKCNIQFQPLNIPQFSKSTQEAQRQNIVQAPIFFQNQQQLNTYILCQHYQIGIFFAYFEQEIYSHQYNMYHKFQEIPYIQNLFIPTSVQEKYYAIQLLSFLIVLKMDNCITKISNKNVINSQLINKQLLFLNYKNLKKEFQANGFYYPEERLELQQQNTLIYNMKMIMKQLGLTYKNQNFYYLRYLKLLYALHQLAEANDKNLYQVVMNIQLVHNNQNSVIAYLNQIYQ